ncbi:MAG: Asp-tRNA(Asn)/Glu-tRNA(Gln) amidotransferase subunit GatA [Myxococcales bacterium]|nr:Asp-tRNA(Asn)/Glu-tRNA(Gln) amidotransferase subunit GatA [Myxococcales bacterium]USN51572.1 MAG: Asp-tRNA(Asn)/Glu-tRNA(Gln) amidotransferase subunit GatA [Myxococcales bacterium]
MAPTELLTKNIDELSKELQNLSITSEELTRACLNQIERGDKKLGAMLWLEPEISLKQARESDGRLKNKKALGMLDGIPVALKDMMMSQDFYTTAASRILEGYQAPYDATVVKKLRAAGAVIVGKTNQDEFAMGSSNESSAYKLCRNPWNLEHTPGGSSGGSAVAVNAGMCLASLGTDTGGSIRQPAAYCGTVGVKPSYGRVSRFGIVAFASSLDQVGPFANSVKDSAIVLSNIAGFDENDSTSINASVPDYYSQLKLDVRGKKIGIAKEYFGEGIQPCVRKAVEKTIEILKENGATIVDVSLPHTKYAVATYYIIATAEASSNLSRYDGIRFGPRKGEEQGLMSLYETTRGELFGTEVKRRIMLGTYVLSAGYYDAYYRRAQQVRRLFAQDFERAFEKVDILLSPTTPTTAFKIGEKVSDPLSMYLNDIYTISANLAGLCGISVPVGLDNAGLPIGAQLLAKPFDEQSLFDAAAVIEKSVNFAAHRTLA